MLPLEGVRVLDFGQVGACPVCGVILANLGADVIKVERVTGESMRRGVPPPLIGQHSEEILQELGYTTGEIDELINLGVIRTPGRWVKPE